ncbi:hypothetical protein NC653_041122 [Populus alba x Populus x berolinensis]|uniref:Uncharacterized protein n=1 Tax=Populus alba x Populus x berolinensis TaxID=444605 RepID=A0AAD6L829_9ROSI|nr:hypothetical protein NC653_041122 [Populus alba x Populus x berolinensis]
MERWKKVVHNRSHAWWAVALKTLIRDMLIHSSRQNSAGSLTSSVMTGALHRVFYDFQLTGSKQFAIVGVYWIFNIR